MNAYESYVKEPCALELGQMQSLYGELCSEIGSDPEAMELFDDLIGAATDYAAIRARWLRMSVKERAEADSRRTALHNSVIIRFNMLARFLRAQGKQALWRDRLGDEEQNRYFRKTIGDFACYIVFINSISAR